MQSLILVLHILVSIAIIALVLLQHGRGADVGAAFGSGSSNTMFGSAGAMPFLMKLTVICATLFFLTSLSLSYIAAHEQKNVNKLNMPVLPVEQATPALPAHQSAPANAFSFTPSAGGKK